MSETKVQRRFSYYGAGFEVVLHNAPLTRVGGEWVLGIEPGEVDQMIFDAVPRQSSRLTGNQIRFVRDFAGMTLKAFAERFGVSHAAVKKWESTGDGLTNMAWATEKDIRLFVFNRGPVDAYAFHACYEELVVERAGKPTRIHIDLESLAAA